MDNPEYWFSNMNKSMIFFVFLFLVMLFVVLLNLRSVYAEMPDPTGRYKAIISFYSYLSFIPMAPGSSSDKPCFIRIIDSHGNNFGEIPVPMIQLAREIEWTGDGAQITSIGEWDFDKKTCFYWNEAQNEKIHVITK